MCCIMKVPKQTFAIRKKVSLANTIHHSSFIYNQFKKLNLCKFYSNRVINHLMSILISIFISGYHGKTTDFAKNSSCHRTTIAHFLNSGKWDDSLLSDTLKCSVIEIIYSEAARTGNLFSVLWTIRLLQRQSLRHRLYIRLKMRIFTNPI